LFRASAWDPLYQKNIDDIDGSTEKTHKVVFGEELIKAGAVTIIFSST
jgi:hypothetical protein